MRSYFIRFLDHCRAGYKANTYTQNQKSGGGGQVPTWVGGNSTNSEAMATTTVGSGATGEARVAVPMAIMDIKKGTWVHSGSKGIHPTSPTHRKDRIKLRSEDPPQQR